jgi:hypothetical protein
VMDTVTYFKHMERVFWGTAGIKVYKEDYMRSSDEVEPELHNHSDSSTPLEDGEQTRGMSCPLCNVGFRVSQKASGQIECPCCNKYFSVPSPK